ncbi:MAG TPA: alpha/beta fold hydrolase [Xanthobacteraceae bacterium]|nr:alpha/beta fold hydrolase [Xanthobacteraceae bacterium]
MTTLPGATFVLVPGAWHGGWCWNRLVPLLEASGHRALTVTLAGLGDRAHLAGPSINLNTHVTDVASLLEMDDLNDVILVGHSYGGMVITGAAERSPKRIRRLIYLDALVPTHGQSAFDLNSAQFRERLEKEAKEKGDGYKIAPIVDILGIEDAKDLEWVRARLRPHPIGTFSEPVDAPAFASKIPSTFILCKRFGFGETAERCRGKGWPVFEIDSGHDAMIIKPRELSELLVTAARQ